MLNRRRANCAFARGLRHRLRGVVTESQQYVFGPAFAGGQFGQRGAKRRKAKVIGAIRSFHAVEKGGNFNQLVPGIQKIEIENLLASHGDLRLQFTIYELNLACLRQTSILNLLVGTALFASGAATAVRAACSGAMSVIGRCPRRFRPRYGR
jgi:hypothetical protein